MATTGITAALLAAGRDVTEPLVSPAGDLVLVGVRADGRSGFVVVPLAGGPERSIATDPSPALGRDLGGGAAAWLADGTGFVYCGSDGRLWCHRLDGVTHPVTPPVPDGEAPRPVSSPALSPDGRSVAYVVDLAEVRVVALAGGDEVVTRAASDFVTGAASDFVTGAASDFVTDPAWDPATGALAWQAWSVPHMAWDESAVWSVVPGAGQPPVAIAGGPGVQVQQPRFGPDGARWEVRDDGGWLNLWRDGVPMVDEPHEHAGPTWGPGQRSYAVSPDGSQAVFARNEDGFGRLCVVDVATRQVREVAKGIHGQLSWVGSTVVALRTGARTPTQVVAYDTQTWERRVLAVGPCAEWDHVGLSEPEPLPAAAPDGRRIPARRWNPPPSVPSRGLICWMHGGPTAQWTVSFQPRIAYWAARGWTVLTPDHRGSTGYGRAFQQALRGGWGSVDVDDVAEVLRAAHAAGLAEPSRTVLMGGSAGGFTALNVLLAHPELVAGAAVVYPVTDLVALDEDTHRFEAHYTATLAGPRSPGDAAAAERYRGRSPLTHAESVRRPVLILHGDADPVVSVGQTLEFGARARAAGAPVEVHVYEGEGHGFRRADTKRDELERTEAFLDRVVPQA